MHASPQSSIGQKALMAATGLILLAFVISHLLGNLLVFAGPEALNAYALKLRHMAPLLWLARALLLLAVVVHLWTSIRLSRQNRLARPVGYRRFRPGETSLSARTMLLSGVLLLAYLVYHLLQFTFHTTDPALAHLTDPLGNHDVYAMVITAFRNPWISCIYVVGMAALCAHLSHGFDSSFQSLGVNNERLLPLLQRVGQALSLAIFMGYSSIPVAVLLGIVKLR